MNSEINYTVSAPGKVILFGEHSVVYKKAAVSTSINRRLFVKVNSVDAEDVLLKLPQISSEIVFDLKQLNKIVKEQCPLQASDAVYSILKPDLINHDIYIESLKGKLEYLGVSLSDLPEKTVDAYLGFLYVMRGMCHTLNCDLVPFSLEVTSELEVGTGIGSSAAFAVAISAAVFHYCKCLEIRNNLKNTLPDVQDNVIISSGNKNSGFSLNEMRIINKWAFCLEKIMHGRPSGIDNTTSTFGSVVMTSQADRPGELTFRFSENIPKIALLLIYTGVTRNTVHLVSKVRKLKNENSAAVDAILNAMDVIAKEAFTTLDGLGVTDSDTKEGKELYETLGSLMELNHGLLRTLGVSHESLEEIVDTCGRHGLSSKLTGAGGGGYAITLVPPNFSREDLEDLKNEFGPEFNVTEINIAEQGVRLDK